VPGFGLAAAVAPLIWPWAAIETDISNPITVMPMAPMFFML